MDDNKDKQERGGFRKKAGGFIVGLFMGAWAMLLVVGGWILRGRLAPEEK